MISFKIIIITKSCLSISVVRDGRHFVCPLTFFSVRMCEIQHVMKKKLLWSTFGKCLIFMREEIISKQKMWPKFYLNFSNLFKALGERQIICSSAIKWFILA